jgi:hypothetical protein
MKESHSISNYNHRHKTHITMFQVLTNKRNIQRLLENTVIVTQLSHVCSHCEEVNWQFEITRLTQILSL